MSSDLISIFIFAVIAGFLIFRLYSVLGQRTGFEPPKEQPVEKPENFKSQSEVSLEEDTDKLSNPALKRLVKSIKSHDPTFDVDEFLKGATRAFEIILEAFAGDDVKTLKNLLGSVIYEEFETTIKERQEQGETLETTIIKIESPRLVEGRIRGSIAEVTVEFQTEQIHVIRDKRGKIIDGHPKQIEQLIDLWTFKRDLTQGNPNWILIKTST